MPVTASYCRTAALLAVDGTGLLCRGSQSRPGFWGKAAVCSPLNQVGVGGTNQEAIFLQKSTSNIGDCTAA
jgi:hypothetical protein